MNGDLKLIRLGIGLCLVSKDNRLNEMCVFPQDAPSYTLYDDGDCYVHDQHATARNHADVMEKFSLDADDELSVILNTKDHELYIQKNHDEKILFVNNISLKDGIKYKMAITMGNCMNSVSLIDFKQGKI